MSIDEAKKICLDWFAHNEAMRQRSVKMQELAKLARTNGPEARKQLAAIDRQPVVYDGSKLEPAVKVLLAAIEVTP